MNHRTVLQVAISIIAIFGSGCSDRSAEQNEALQVWRVMVKQAEQMRAQELRDDVQRLKDLADAGDSEIFEHEREKICRKWSKVERLSPVPVDLGYVPELIPIPAELPCKGFDSDGVTRGDATLLPDLNLSISSRFSGVPVNRTAFRNLNDETAWLKEMSQRLARELPDEAVRLEFLRTLHWEASRSGIDPQLMLALIQVESGFRKDAVSAAGEIGYTQVNPSWIEVIGSPDHDLFHLRTNLRYGTLILRHYIDVEGGDLFFALGRYNGTPGQPDFPRMVVDTWKRNWDYAAVRQADD